MQFIKIDRNVITKDKCEEIISYYKVNNADDVYKQYAQRNPIVNELTTTELNDHYWNKLENDLQEICNPILEQYLLPMKHDLNSFFFEHLSIMQYKKSTGRKPHYDIEFDYRDGEHLLRRFAILIYLNDNFEGGEVAFPIQGIIQKPEPGLMVIFPTSFMYPHFTIPHIGEERFVLRLHYYLKMDCIL